MKLFRVCLIIFPFKEKEFPRKSLYFCMVMFLLYLLKFIHSYIKFLQQWRAALTATANLSGYDVKIYPLFTLFPFVNCDNLFFFFFS